MCGFAGIISTNPNREGLSRLVQKMSEEIRHRGPDGHGILSGPGYALSHRRLAIIDVAGGAQPMLSHNRDLAMVFNGEIYNYKQLRVELAKSGIAFTTNSDSEVLLQSWQQWGIRALEKIEGMFAFAIWQYSTSTLWLVRDRFGIKTLYFSLGNDGTAVFGSELKALLAFSEIQREGVNTAAILDYLTIGYVPPGKGFFTNIEQLRPAECVEYCRFDNRVRRLRYWRPIINQSTVDSGSYEVGALWNEISTSVKTQLVSDVPVAVFLSGGLDSSAVTAAMSTEYNCPTTAYSIEVRHVKHNEIEHARTVASTLGVRLLERKVDEKDIEDMISITGIYDEPFADSSCIPTSILCQFASGGHKVTLSGDGGDELFAGYGWHIGNIWRNKIRRILGRRFVESSASIAGQITQRLRQILGRAPAAGVFASLAVDPIAGYVASQGISTTIEPRSLLSYDLEKELRGYCPSQQFRDLASESGISEPLSMAQYLDMHMYLPGDILTKLDRASMRYSLEARVPLLDEKLVRFTNQLPRSTILTNGRAKGLLLDEVTTHVPLEAVDRPKQGFSIPLDEWFDSQLGNMFESQLHGSASAVFEDYLNVSRCQELLKQHRTRKYRHGPILWAIFVLMATFERIVHDGA